jgi:predicted nucleotide-binding protein
MNKSLSDRLQSFVDAGEALDSGTAAHEMWQSQVHEFLLRAVGVDEARAFWELAERPGSPSERHGRQVGYLEGVLETLVTERSETQTAAAADTSRTLPGARKVFIVHGHDGEAKETLARFLGRLGLEPIILHEQPNAGATLIEKFEVFSRDVAFAVVLLTPDDVGAKKSTSPNLVPRARQNVILELGYFMGKLGRGRVCALYRKDLDLPSDYQGVVYVEMDDAGAWKTRLAQELVHCKLSIQLEALLGG